MTVVNSFECDDRMREIGLSLYFNSSLRLDDPKGVATTQLPWQRPATGCNYKVASKLQSGSRIGPPQPSELLLLLLLLLMLRPILLVLFFVTTAAARALVVIFAVAAAARLFVIVVVAAANKPTVMTLIAVALHTQFATK